MAPEGHIQMSSYLWEIQFKKQLSITPDPPCAYPPLTEQSTNIGDISDTLWCLMVSYGVLWCLMVSYGASQLVIRSSLYLVDLVQN